MMLWILLIYCVGTCPAYWSGPDDVLFYSSLADCKKEMVKLGKIDGNVFGEDGKLLPHAHFLQKCAHMYAEPEQLDRILNPAKLEKLLRDNGHLK
jgi:hypothetical protein